MNTKWLDDLFYFLRKDYGTQIVYTKIGKSNINYDSGARADIKDSFEIDAILAPVSLYAQYLEKVIGSVERAATKFLVRKDSLPSLIESEDYLIHNNVKYGDLKFEDCITLIVISGVSAVDAKAYQVLNLSTYDNLGINDGV